MGLVEYFGPLQQDPILVRVLITMVILALAYIVGKGMSLAVSKSMSKMKLKKEKKTRETVKTLTRTLELVVIVFAIIIALSSLQVSGTEEAMRELWIIIPNVLAAVLVVLLGILFVNLIMEMVGVLLKKMEKDLALKEYGISGPTIDGFLLVAKIWLYIVVIVIAFSLIGIETTLLQNILMATIYAGIVLAVALGFYTFKDVLRNSLLSKYVKKHIVKPKQVIRVNGFEGMVMSVSSHGVKIKHNGKTTIIPNSQIMGSSIEIIK